MDWTARKRPPSLALIIIMLLIISNPFGLCEAKRVKERDLQVITLKEGMYTAARRTQPVPQLRCLSNCARTPKTVQCYNRGWDGSANNWECKAALPNGVSFGSMDVNCEGYDYPDDPYITVGSCSLSYHLVSQGSYGGSPQKPFYYSRDSWRGTLYSMIFYSMLFIIVYTLYKACRRPSMRVGRGADDGTDYWGWDGNGGAGGGPPPPGGPGFRPDLFGQTDGCGGARPANGPGFWSGAMAGGLLGYLFGNRGNAYGYGGNYDYTQSRWRQRSFQNVDDGYVAPTYTNWTSSDSSGTSRSSGFATGSRR